VPAVTPLRPLSSITASTTSARVQDPDPARRRLQRAALGFPVTVRTGDGSTVTLEHLERGVQPTQLFTVPAGYRRLDPRALIERMRHSDVWAGRD